MDSTAFIKYEYRNDSVDRCQTYVAEEMNIGNEQYDFLVNDLQNCNTTWKFVFFHYPPYVSSDYEVDKMRTLCPVFEKYKVDVVFCSHSIVYERSHPICAGKVDFGSGVTYIVAGGAGATGEWFHPKRSWHTA